MGRILIKGELTDRSCVDGFALLRANRKHFISALRVCKVFMAVLCSAIASGL